MKIVRFSAALGALAVASAAHAADPSDSQTIVVTGAGVAQDIRNVGQAITVIDRQTLDQRQTVVLSDILATTPGLTVARNGGLGGVTSVFIRGAESAQTLTLIDGVRVNDPSSPGGGFDFANLLAGAIHRVEVLRGPNSVPWGSQAIGGVVNVVTQAPTEHLQAHANAEYGSMNSLFANGGVSGSSGILSGSLTGGYLRTDGISAYAKGTEADGYRQYGTTGQIGVAFTPTLRLDLRGYYANSRTNLDGFPAPLFAFADDREYSTAKEFYGYAGLHADFLNGRFHNTIAFALADIDRDNYDRAAGPAPLFLFRGRSKRYTYQGDIQPLDMVRIVLGAEHEDTRFNDGKKTYARGVSSGWGEAILTPFARLTVTGGVRYDSDDAFGGHTTFGANAAYALPTDTTIRASYAEGFKAPTLYQLYAPFYGTPSLRPETAKSYDVGIEQSLLGKAVTASLTYFHRRTTNQIDFDAKTFTYRNIDAARAEGAEFALALRPIDPFTVTAEYSFINSRNLTPGILYGKELQRRPRQTVSVSADYRLPFGLSVGGTILSVDHSYDDTTNLVRLDGYTLIGLRAELPIGKHFSVYGRIDNLFDEKYQTVSGYGTIGRAAYGGIRVKFD